MGERPAPPSFTATGEGRLSRRLALLLAAVLLPVPLRAAPPPFAWENNNLGVTNRVIDPWTPLLVQEQTISCWGRDYTFNNLALPETIVTLQPEPSRGTAIADVLARPVELVAVQKNRLLRWTFGEKQIVSATESRVELTGSATTTGLKATVEGSLDSDGFYTVHLTITPAADGVMLRQLWLEIAGPTKAARLFYCAGENARHNHTIADLNPDSTGLLWDSKTAAHNTTVTGNFLPMAWIGDEDRGIAWICDNDETWVTDPAKPCLELTRIHRTTEFRVYLLNKPGLLTHPIEVTFGLQATPVRPRPAGGSWKSRRWHVAGPPDEPLIRTGAFDASPAGNPAQPTRTPWQRRFSLQIDRIPASDPTYGPVLKAFGAEWFLNAAHACAPTTSHIDFVLAAYKQWHDLAGCTGAAYEDTGPVAASTSRNQAGWIDDNGQPRAGYRLLQTREFMKRARAFWLSVAPAPVIAARCTDALAPGYLGFADYWLDGDTNGYPDPSVQSPDFVDRWYNHAGLAHLRLTLGRQWGVMPQWTGPAATAPTRALLGQFDLDTGSSPITVSPYAFGLTNEDCLFIPSWDVRELASVTKGGPDVLVATWQRLGRARILVSNLSNTNRLVTVRLNWKTLGLPLTLAATDEQTGTALTCSQGTIPNLAVLRHNYRTILVAAPGVFPPAAKTPTPAPQPKKTN